MVFLNNIFTLEEIESSATVPSSSLCTLFVIELMQDLVVIVPFSSASLEVSMACIV